MTNQEQYDLIYEKAEKYDKLVAAASGHKRPVLNNFEKMLRRMSKDRINRLIEHFCKDNCLFYSVIDHDLTYSEGINLPCDICPYKYEFDCSNANANYLKGVDDIC